MREKCYKKKYVFIDYLKAIAALLIVNSHFDKLYPISALATGGAIGNAIFFATSGFCLFPISSDFKDWMINKLIRIYIPTIIMVCVSLIINNNGIYNMKNVVAVFIWPTMYWFVGAIVLFYILYYILKGIISNKAFICFFLIIGIFYLIYYSVFLDTSVWVIENPGLDSIEGYFKLIYYFAIMMIGKWFRINFENIPMYKKWYLFNIGASVIATYGFKYLMVKNNFFYHWQFFDQLCVIWFVFALLAYSASIENEMAERNNLFHKIVKFIGNITLEMYLVQFIIIRYAERFKFPISILLSFGGIIIAAFCLNTFSRMLGRKLRERKRKCT